jgi:twitching motility protein PilI
VQMLASMEEIVEIINQVPVLTRVPGAKPWVRGVVNFRGNLLPLMDLQQLMNGRPLLIGRQARILVVDQAGTLTGLLVSSLGGRKRFPRADFTQLLQTPAAIATFVEGGFMAEGVEWPVFSLARLLAYPDYQSAAR